MDQIAIIVVNYNTEEDTVECLKSLTNLKTKNFHHRVIVVDNGSRENFVLPKAIQSDTFEVVRSESNLGFTGGNNLGITYALENYHPDYLLLLNNDTTVEPNFLIELHQIALSNPKWGITSPKIYFFPEREYHRESYTSDDRGNVLWYGGGSIDWPNLVAFHRGVDELDRGQFDIPQTSDYSTGCAMFIRREVLEKIGLFDERFFLYMEDVDLSLRTQAAGYDIGLAPGSKIWHKNAGSSGGSGSELHQYYQTRNRLFFGLKHGSARVKLTTIILALRLSRSQNKAERLAVLDLMTGQVGKRVVI